jgi:D-alanyl-D-alanine dipeptidase
MTVKIRFQLQILLFAVISFSTCAVDAQQTVNKYGLWVIKDIKMLNALTAMDSNKKIIDIKNAIPGLVFDLRYAGTNNFMHKKLYPEITTTYLRLPAAKALQKVQQELNENGMGLKIFDGYRPYSVTEKMWELVKDDRYAADPKKGSGHNRGVAVDVTIVKLKDGLELNMGTAFDNFSDTAHHTFKNLSAETEKNRKLLKSTMEKYGFNALETEWWHYSLPDAKNYELLDLDFKKLKKLRR